MSNQMNSEDSNDIYNDSTDGMVTFRSSHERPTLKLSVKLIETYKNINKVGYTKLFDSPFSSILLIENTLMIPTLY